MAYTSDKAKIDALVAEKLKKKYGFVQEGSKDNSNQSLPKQVSPQETDFIKIDKNGDKSIGFINILGFLKPNRGYKLFGFNRFTSNSLEVSKTAHHFYFSGLFDPNEFYIIKDDTKSIDLLKREIESSEGYKISMDINVRYKITNCANYFTEIAGARSDISDYIKGLMSVYVKNNNFEDILKFSLNFKLENFLNNLENSSNGVIANFNDIQEKYGIEFKDILFQNIERPKSLTDADEKKAKVAIETEIAAKEKEIEKQKAEADLEIEALKGVAEYKKLLAQLGLTDKEFKKLPPETRLYWQTQIQMAIKTGTVYNFNNVPQGMPMFFPNDESKGNSK
jgi:regulator of protease activity HflC (stomatin/prohibitin superfamily)